MRLRSGFLLTAFAILMGSCGPPDRQSRDALVGHWLGNLSYRDATARLECDFTLDGDSLVGHFTCDELLIRDAPVGQITFAPPRVRLERLDIAGAWVFEGWLRRNLTVGSLRRLPLRSSDRTALSPQLSLRHTYPSQLEYRIDTLRIEEPQKWAAARAYIPRIQGPHPAVLLVGGTAGVDIAYRYALADRFARAGFVAMVYEQQRERAITDSLSQAEAAFDLLRRRPEVDSRRIGLWGALQAAPLALRLASRRDVVFVVAVSGPTDPPQPWMEARPPLLALYGARDSAGAGTANAERLRGMLRHATRRDVSVLVVPGADGRLRLARRTGEAFDWPREAPGAVDTMITWMRRLSHPRP